MFQYRLCLSFLRRLLFENSKYSFFSVESKYSTWPGFLPQCIHPPRYHWGFPIPDKPSNSTHPGYQMGDMKKAEMHETSKKFLCITKRTKFSFLGEVFASFRNRRDRGSSNIKQIKIISFCAKLIQNNFPLPLTWGDYHAIAFRQFHDNRHAGSDLQLFWYHYEICGLFGCIFPIL